VSLQDLGRAGERAARRVLKKHGYKVLATNWRCRQGEIDVVATHKGVLCFVEVKTQSAFSDVPATEEVTALKQRHLTRAAAEFLRRTGRLERPCRFDVVSVVMDENDRPTTEIIPDAFPALGPHG